MALVPPLPHLLDWRERTHAGQGGREGGKEGGASVLLEHQHLSSLAA